MYSWGWDEYGQLGQGIWDIFGANKNRTPRSVRELQGTNIIATACGSSHTVALSAKGEAYAFGWGRDGQLGLGSATKEKKTPSHWRSRRPEFNSDYALVALAAGGAGTKFFTDVSGASAGDLYAHFASTWAALDAEEREDPAALTSLQRVLRAHDLGDLRVGALERAAQHVEDRPRHEEGRQHAARAERQHEVRQAEARRARRQRQSAPVPVAEHANKWLRDERAQRAHALERAVHRERLLPKVLQDERLHRDLREIRRERRNCANDENHRPPRVEEACDLTPPARRRGRRRRGGRHRRGVVGECWPVPSRHTSRGSSLVELFTRIPRRPSSPRPTSTAPARRPCGGSRGATSRPSPRGRASPPASGPRCGIRCPRS